MSTIRSRGWCLTINDDQLTATNWESKFKASFEVVTWSIRQFEKATTGQRHIQAAIYSANARQFSAVQKLFPGAHLEVMNGTCADSLKYCSKEETRVVNTHSVEHGISPKQGKRSDMKSFAAGIEDAISMVELAKADPSTFIRYNKGLIAYQLLCMPKRTHMTTLEVMWGPTGSGKSTGIRANLKNTPYFQLTKSACSDKVTWFDGYDPIAHKVLVIDDFYGWIPMHTFLNMVDAHPMTVQTKGGSTQYLFERIIITSNVQPKDWYQISNPAVKAAFLRRLQPPWCKTTFVGYGPNKDLPFCPCGQKDGEEEDACPNLHADTSPDYAIASGVILPKFTVRAFKRKHTE